MSNGNLGGSVYYDDSSIEYENYNNLNFEIIDDSTVTSMTCKMLIGATGTN